MQGLLLPHKVYLYQKQPLSQGEVQVKTSPIVSASRMLSCDIENDGDALARVQSVKATGDHVVGDLAGFRGTLVDLPLTRQAEDA
jgi:hypothetical protein